MTSNIAYRRRRPSILRTISISKATLVLFAAAVHCLGAPAWITVQTAHFNVYSTYSARQTEHYAETLELARNFLAITVGTSGLPAMQDVITVRSRQEYAALSISDNTIGTYIRNHYGSYLLFTQLSFETNELLIHELARSILTNMYPQLPWCLAQGMADVYATTRISRRFIKYGGENLILSADAWEEDDDAVHLRDLLHIDKEQLKELNAPTLRVVLGEAWAFAQMLMLSDQYSERFPAFLEDINNGLDVVTGFSRVFNKSLDDVANDLSTYIDRGKFESAHVENRALQSHTRLVAMSPSDVDVLKARVHATREHGDDFAQRHDNTTLVEIVPCGRNRAARTTLIDQSTPRSPRPRSGEDITGT